MSKQQSLIDALRKGVEPRRLHAKRDAKAKVLVQALEAQGARHRLLLAVLRDGGMTRMASRDFAKMRGVVARAELAAQRDHAKYGGLVRMDPNDPIVRQWMAYFDDCQPQRQPRRDEFAYERVMRDMAKPGAFRVEVINEVSKGQP